MKTAEEIAAMTEDEKTNYILSLQTESEHKDSLNESLTAEIANAGKEQPKQILKVGKTSYAMTYGAVKVDKETYNYEALSKLPQEKLKAIVVADDEAFVKQ
ncbi:hypothetical protein LV89_02003 [Arcicella aurantiaca]|uniref:Uncharacterized protein n=1 Tax=Arcicella aurantiaca TaxID=591202 RepID=A0A316EC66_9BACT|nr:hypothetical protein [Arcicella aurantiaca]PWK27188.1 hypothetical protein LV89_02003 [Arcicella aurantiaca]